MRVTCSARYALIVLLPFVLASASTVNATEAVILVESAELRTKDATLGVITRGTLVEATQTSGPFRLVKVPRLEIKDRDESIEYNPNEAPSKSDVLGWVRSTEIYEFRENDSVEVARKHLQRAKQHESRGERDAAIAEYVIAVALFKREKEDLDDETITTAAALIEMLLDVQSLGGFFSSQSDDQVWGLTLLRPLCARLLANSDVSKHRFARQLLYSVKSAMAAGKLKYETPIFGSNLTTLHHQDGVIRGEVLMEDSEGKRLRIADGTEVIILEPFESLGKTESIPSNSPPFYPPNGKLFVRIGKTMDLGIVDTASVARRELSRQSAIFKDLPRLLLNDGLLGPGSPGVLTFDASSEEWDSYRAAISELTISMLGERSSIAAASLKADIIERVGLAEVRFHPYDARLADIYSAAGDDLVKRDVQQAVVMFEKALEVLLTLHNAFPDGSRTGLFGASVKKELGSVMSRLGDCYLTIGDLSAARRLLVKGLEFELSSPGFLGDDFLGQDSSRTFSFSRRFSALGDSRTAEELHALASDLPGSLLDQAGDEILGGNSQLLPSKFAPTEAVGALQLLSKRTKGSFKFSNANFLRTIPEIDAIQQEAPGLLTAWSWILHQTGELPRAQKYFDSIPKSVHSELQKQMKQSAGDSLLSLFDNLPNERTRTAFATAMFVGLVLGEGDPDELINGILKYVEDVSGSDVTRECIGLLDADLSELLPPGVTFDNVAVGLVIARRLLTIGDANSSRQVIEGLSRVVRDGQGKETDKISYWNSVAELGELLIQTGDVAGGIRQVNQARRQFHVFSTRSLPYLSFREQLEFLNRSYHPSLSRAIALVVASELNADELVCEWLLNGKARTAETLAGQSRFLIDREKQGGIAVKLRAVQWKLASLMAQKPSPDVDAQIEVLNERLELLAREIGSGVPPKVAPWVSHDDLVKAVPVTAAFVDFFKVSDGLDEPEYVAVVVRNGSSSLHRIGATRVVDSLIRETRQLMAKSPQQLRSAGPVTSTRQANTVLAKLEKATLGKLRPQIDGVDELIICPDSQLWLAPWPAFYSQSAEEYLVQRMSLRFVTSGRTLTHDDESDDEPRNLAVIIADPDYELDQGKSSSTNLASAEDQSEASYALRSVNSARQLPEAVSRLPRTRDEATAIASSIAKLTGQDAKVILGEEAAETACRDAFRPAVIHIAAHGFFLPDTGRRTETAEHPLLKSGLLFAGFNHRQQKGAVEPEDSVLSALELLGSDFQGTDLVVLSACETGVGDAQSGEGVLGLRQVFEISGARSVVASLWNVDDTESARLMKNFYDNLASGQRKSDALREAQVSRINALQDRFGAAHPFLWAAFTLTGNGSECRASVDLSRLPKAETGPYNAKLATESVADTTKETTSIQSGSRLYYEQIANSPKPSVPAPKVPESTRPKYEPKPESPGSKKPKGEPKRTRPESTKAKVKPPTAAAVAAADQAIAAVREVRDGIVAGQLEVIWDHLNPQAQSDLNELLHELAKHADSEVWSRILATGSKIAQVGIHQADFFSGDKFAAAPIKAYLQNHATSENTPPDEELTKQDAQDEFRTAWHRASSRLLQLVKSEHITQNALRTGNGRDLLKHTVSPAMRILLTLSPFFDDDPINDAILRQLPKVVVTAIPKNETECTVELHWQNGEPSRFNFELIEERWVPQILKASPFFLEWTKQPLKEGMQDFEKNQKQTVLKKLDEFDVLLDQLMTAKTQELFDVILEEFESGAKAK